MKLYHGMNKEFDRIDFIDLPTLVRNLKYMKGITIQYFFGTERAIRLLQRV